MVSAKKRFSRKNKSSWRKFINIRDVEEFLEEKQQEERIGLLLEKKGEDIFIDDNSTKKKLSITQKRKLNASKERKNLLPLKNLSNVEDPITRRNHVKLLRHGRRVNKFCGEQTKLERSEKKTGNTFYNVWQYKDQRKEEFLSNEWLNRDLGLYHLKNIGKPTVKVHESAHHKTNLAKALPFPHPGTSYNPSLIDHQDLIKVAVEKEKKIVKENDHLNRVTTQMFSKVSQNQQDSLWTSDMCLESDDITQQNDTELVVSINPPVQNKKKSKKARRNQKEQRSLNQQLGKKKEEKRKIADIHRVKHIQNEIIKEETKKREIRRRKKISAIRKKYDTKVISKVKYQEPEIEVNLAEDISGNLRNIKVETSLLLDRFNNLQKRNIIPTTIDLGPRKKRKVKKYIRSTHKE